MVGAEQVNPHHRDPVNARRLADIGTRITVIR